LILNSLNVLTFLILYFIIIFFSVYSCNLTRFALHLLYDR
jgi:hypothetical protein